MNTLYLDFYGKRVLIQSEWSEILTLLKKDFSLFVCQKASTKNKSLSLTIYKKRPDKEKIPNAVSKMQSLNSITFQENKIRYNDYYGKLLSQFNYATEEAVLYSEDKDKMHEVAYLLILSRVGKRLDREGLHKLHAFAISYGDKAFVCMMPMKGGKSTLLLELLKNEKVKMISDDIPLFDSSGNVLTFPIKVGADEELLSRLGMDMTSENVYYINREQYGKKMLLCLDAIKDKVELPGKKFSRVVIAEGFRYHSDQSFIMSSSWLKTFKGLFKHGVIGIGLPMILEYFWEFGFIDFCTKTMIFFQRLKAFTWLSFRAKRMSLKLGRKPELAAKEIISYLENIK